jgi:two-component system response regulator YesN
VSNIFDVDWKELSFHAKNGIEDKVTAFIDSYISKLSELGNIELSTLRMLCANIISVLNTVLNDMGKKISDIFKSDSDIYKRLGEIETLKDAAEVLKEYGVQITQYINEIKGKKVNDLAQKAKEYIDSNYTKADLNLTDIASNLYVNQSYLSRVFKVETKESIVDYISKLRINKSIEYIANTNLKAYEIAEKVGINDPHYFSICFKKYTGKSVNEFKKTVGSKNC